MKTVIFCTSYINENSGARYKKWIDYYHGKLDLFQSSNLFLIDDGSSNKNFDNKVHIIKSDSLPIALEDDINLFHFENNLGRISLINYPGWWRSFTFSLMLAEKYDIDKLIHIESDFYIVSRKMIDYIAGLTSGWTAFYSKYHKFPETAIQIICKDSFKKFDRTLKKAIETNYTFSKRAEHILPFTKIEKGFQGDRFGEANVMRGWLRKFQPPFEIDYIGQMNEKYNLKDYKQVFKFDYT